MKKEIRRLRLSRETLATLSEATLRDARGGVTNRTCDVSGCYECPVESYAEVCVTL